MTTFKNGRKPTVNMEEPKPITVSAKELSSAVSYKEESLSINSLVQHSKEQAKLFNETLTKAYSLNDMVSELRYKLGKLESDNEYKTGYNNQLQNKINELENKIILLEAELNEVEEEEPEPEGLEQLTTVNGVSKLIEQFKELAPMFMNNSQSATVNAPPSNEAPVEPNNFFGNDNNALLSLLVQWHQLDNEMSTVLYKIIVLAKTNPDKYAMAKSML